MGTLRPIGESESVVLEFRAKISREYIDRTIDESGLRPAEEWWFVFNLGEVDSADLRHRLRRAYERYVDVEPYPTLPEPDDNPEIFLNALEPWLDEVEEMEAGASVLSAAFIGEMKTWVAANGSRRLQLAVDRGYRANTSYALERAGNEMPGFWVDTAEDCEWGERVDPTEDALLLEKKVKSWLDAVDSSLDVRIVWLTETPRALDRKMEAHELNFEAQEALIVPEYLGRYLLVMPMDKDLQRDPKEDF